MNNAPGKNVYNEIEKLKIELIDINNDCKQRLLKQNEVRIIIEDTKKKLNSLLPADSKIFRIYDRLLKEDNNWWTETIGSDYCSKDDCKHVEYWINAVDEILNGFSSEPKIDTKIGSKKPEHLDIQFDPWGPIESLLFEFDSDKVQNIVSRAGLTINWNLNKAQSFSHKTRNRAYRERIALAYTNLNQDQKVVIAENILKEILSENNELKNQINILLDRLGWMFKDDHLLTKSTAIKTFENSEEDYSNMNKIFIIHGHDKGLKRDVQLLISSARLDYLVLHEKADKGRNIIDKLIEEGKDASYVIALMSPDDELIDGSRRARQNVILEIGYFLGKLGKEKVRILKKGNVEIPSDLHGILYTDYDTSGTWKMKIFKEMKAVGINIDLEEVVEKI